VKEVLKHQILQRTRDYWDAGDFLEAGISLFERIPRKHRSTWATNLLKVVYDYSLPSAQIEAVIDFGNNPKQWMDESTDRYREAHAIVEEVNELHFVTEEPLSQAIFTLTKNVGKVIYNAYGYRAPFDHSAGWEIAGDINRVIVLVNDADFSTRVLSVLFDKNYIELEFPIECSNGCPVCNRLLGTDKFEDERAMAIVGGKHISAQVFFEITRFSSELI